MRQFVLTKETCPSGSRLLYLSDVHIPTEDRPALEVMVSLAEDVGVTGVIAAGDIYDCYCISEHPKQAERILENGTLREEAAKGLYLTTWLSTRPVVFIEGNHEDRINRFVDKNPALHGLTVKEVLGLPDQWVYLPNGGQVRLGNLVMSHGDTEFKKSTGGRYPAQKLLDMAPDQSSIIGHLHRIGQARRTSYDEQGIPRTRAAWTNGHLSRVDSHYEYVSRYIGWQTGFITIDVMWEEDRPRFAVYQHEVLRDRYNRPYVLFNGKCYR